MSAILFIGIQVVKLSKNDATWHCFNMTTWILTSDQGEVGSVFGHINVILKFIVKIVLMNNDAY